MGSDRIAARVLRDKGKYIFSGGILPFQIEASQTLLKIIKNSSTGLEEILKEIGEKQQLDREQLKTIKADSEILKESTPAFTSIWLIDNLERLQSPMPTLVNRDGDEIMFIQTRFPILEENADEIAKHLDTDNDWEREDPNENRWIWLTALDAGTTSKAADLEDEELIIAAFLELKNTVLTMETNSTERNDQATQKLQVLLDDLIGPPLS